MNGFARKTHLDTDAKTIYNSASESESSLPLLKLGLRNCSLRGKENDASKIMLHCFKNIFHFFMHPQVSDFQNIFLYIFKFFVSVYVCMYVCMYVHIIVCVFVCVCVCI